MQDGEVLRSGSSSGVAGVRMVCAQTVDVNATLLLAPVPIAQKHRREIAHSHRKATSRAARSERSYLHLSLEVAALRPRCAGVQRRCPGSSMASAQWKPVLTAAVFRYGCGVSKQFLENSNSTQIRLVFARKSRHVAPLNHSLGGALADEGNARDLFTARPSANAEDWRLCQP